MLSIEHWLWFSWFASTRFAPDDERVWIKNSISIIPLMILWSCWVMFMTFISFSFFWQHLTRLLHTHHRVQITFMSNLLTPTNYFVSWFNFKFKWISIGYQWKRIVQVFKLFSSTIEFLNEFKPQNCSQRVRFRTFLRTRSELHCEKENHHDFVCLSWKHRSKTRQSLQCQFQLMFPTPHNRGKAIDVCQTRVDESLQYIRVFCIGLIKMHTRRRGMSTQWNLFWNSSTHAFTVQSKTMNESCKIYNGKQSIVNIIHTLFNVLAPSRWNWLPEQPQREHKKAGRQTGGESREAGKANIDLWRVASFMLMLGKLNYKAFVNYSNLIYGVV